MIIVYSYPSSSDIIITAAIIDRCKLKSNEYHDVYRYIPATFLQCQTELQDAENNKRVGRVPKMQGCRCWIWSPSVA